MSVFHREFSIPSKKARLHSTRAGCSGHLWYFRCSCAAFKFDQAFFGLNQLNVWNLAKHMTYLHRCDCSRQCRVLENKVLIAVLHWLDIKEVWLAAKISWVSESVNCSSIESIRSSCRLLVELAWACKWASCMHSRVQFDVTSSLMTGSSLSLVVASRFCIVVYRAISWCKTFCFAYIHAFQVFQLLVHHQYLWIATAKAVFYHLKSHLLVTEKAWWTS